MYYKIVHSENIAILLRYFDISVIGFVFWILPLGIWEILHQCGIYLHIAQPIYTSRNDAAKVDKNVFF